MQSHRYRAQLEHKRERVLAALSAAGVFGAPPVAETVPAPLLLGYRTRAKYVLASEGGALVLGGYQPRSHRVVNTIGCAIVEPLVDRAARVTREELSRTRLSVYDERSRRGELRYAVIRSGADGRALVGLAATSDTDRRQLLRAGQRLAEREEIAGAVWIRNDRRSGAILTSDISPLAGNTEVSEELGPVRGTLDITAFSQVNRDQARRLYRAAAALAGAGPGVRALELYCGAGPIGLHLAAAGADVTGVERSPAAVHAGRRAARVEAFAGRIRFETEDASAYLARADRERADVVVVDPPRKGLDAEARGALARAAPERIVYTSCDPTSFSRDAAELGASGYELERVEPWDLMPGTPQVEILARFSRRGAAPTRRDRPGGQARGSARGSARDRR